MVRSPFGRFLVSASKGASCMAPALLVQGCVGGASDAAPSVSGDDPAPRVGESNASESRRVRTPTPTNPLARSTLYVDPSTNAAEESALWASVGYTEGARLMDSIASQPSTLWLGDWTWDVESTVNNLLNAASGKLVTFVVYNIPHRDCDAWSSGGVADAAEYAAFVEAIGRGLAGRTALIVLEPDGLAYTDCLSATEQSERFAMMAAAVTTLTANGARVYLDAGDSNWIPATAMASRLASANVAGAAGFALNVAHTEYTSDEIGYANELRAILGTNAHYIIDTSRNGLGPTSDNQWCNPLERALGSNPTVATTDPGLDALLWVKPPGESDGECNGGPAAGGWWADYARDLAALSGR
ncbi:MAG: glycoside hydrolase family 6 protein [Pseudomonadota bacterium]|nr:glycoside hydrolase family 6 protein [Pseudomonadota bacterium]